MVNDTKNWLKPALGFLVVMGVLRNLSNTLADVDLWGYLAFGRLFWQTGRFPYQDVFAYVPTLNPWIYHEWLTGVLFYPIYESLGGPGLQLVKYALGLGAAGLIYLTARRRGSGPLVAGLGIWVIQSFLTMGYSPVRAQVFTYGFFALYLYLLERARQTGDRRGLWLLPPVMLFWCNLHGGFLAGLGLIGFYILGEALGRRPWRPYAVILVPTILVTLINPYGLDYWKYVLRAVMMPRPEITEWASLLAGYRRGLIGFRELFYFLAIIVFAGCLAGWARWRDSTALLALGVTLYLGVSHQRHVVFFLLLAGAYLPLLLSQYFTSLKSRPGVAAALSRVGWRLPCLGAVALALAVGLNFSREAPWTIKVPPLPGTRITPCIYYPVGAVDYIRRHHLSGKLLLEFNWGEYALWSLYPDCRVALDGRYETVYPDKVCKEYWQFINGRPGWQGFLEHYPPDLVLVDSRAPIYSLLLGEGAWRQVYADSGCALLVKAQGGALPTAGAAAVGP
jgi:hypothetical protein